MGSFRDNLRKIDPYVPGEQPNLPDMIKLNTNENPYPPSPKVQAVVESYQTERLRLYPDPDISRLTAAIGEAYQIPKEQVFVGVGSDDVLAIAFMTFFNSDRPILFPDITYSFYDVWANLFRIPFEQVPLDEDFEISAEDYRKENGGVVIANPNAPTGVYQGVDVIRDIVEHNRDVVVIIDEAYVDFSAEGSVLDLIHTYDNVLVVQTCSKSRALAGMRIGYAFGSPELIAAMRDVRFSFNSYPMTDLSIEIGVASFSDQEYFEKMRDKVVEVREWTKQELRSLGFHFKDSMTNFIFASHQTVSAQEIFDRLREKHIFVRHFRKPRIENYLRISIGTKEEMEALIAALKEILKK